MSSLYVKKWQRLLTDNVRDIGPIDGDFGPRTFSASLEYAQATAHEPQKPDAPKFNIGGVEKPRYAPELKPARRPVNELIWHCAATPEGKSFVVADIRRWHKARGWDDIGYHYVVLLDGSVMTGRPIEKIGAHVSGHNTGTIGACYIGGVTATGGIAKDTRTEAQKASMLWLTKELVRFHNLSRISGHNQYAAKACPSFDVRQDVLGNIPGFIAGNRV